MKEHVVFFTGAGISASTGLGTYRGPDGLWTNNPDLEAKSNFVYYNNHRDEMNQFWDSFRAKCAQALPTESHRIIARYQHERFDQTRVSIITQNVDGLHFLATQELVDQKVVSSAELTEYEPICELHGNIFRYRCSDIECTNMRFLNEEECLECHGPVRPDIVMFGEDLPRMAWSRAQRACLSANTFIAIGTSGMVRPACDLVTVARSAGAKTILINKEPWEFPHPDFNETLIGESDTLLAEILC